MSLTSSVGSAASALGLSAPECAPSPSASQNHSVAQSSQSIGPASPATTTCAPSPQADWLMTESALTSSAEGSPAKTSAPPAKAQVLGGGAADCGESMPALLAKYDRDTLSWRTSQHCFIEGLEKFSEIWPRSGMTRNGIAYQLPTLAHLTDATASGLWPTPTANQQLAASIPALLNEAKRLHPKGQWSLGTQVAADHVYGHRMWPTPDASPHKYRLQGDSQQSRSLNGIHGGKLNPTWVEWLMGFPLGWTDLKPSEMPSSRKYRKSSAGQ